MQTAIITLSALLLASVVGHIFQAAKNRVLHNKINSKERQLLQYRTNASDPQAIYEVIPLVGGKYQVNRITHPDGEHAIVTVIRIFDTDDAEYNFNRAVELVDKITERICYK